jgi:hydroxymethylbilane synthase
LQLDAAWGDPADVGAGAAFPTPLVQAQKTAEVRSFDEAEALGEAVAAQLRAGGAVWASNAPAV